MLRYSQFAMTSIIIVTHNSFIYTKRCLNSIWRFTHEPYELIFVDNNSTDDTLLYLQELNITVLYNTENRGFPAAVNQGIEVAQGKQILLLNNDTIVTTGWLRRMLNRLYSDQDIGLVGPHSNNTGGDQRITVDYHLSELEDFAQSISYHNREQQINIHQLMGFCLLIKREVIEQIGLFDERFGIGNFEDTDYCYRAIQAGYKAIIAQDVFIHHFGSRTFKALGIDLKSLLRENRKKYKQKWSS